MNIEVLIVGGSAMIRNRLARVLSMATGIEVVGVTGELFLARKRIEKLKPDVLVLNGEMLATCGESPDNSLPGVPAVILTSDADNIPGAALGAVGPSVVCTLEQPWVESSLLEERLVFRLVDSIHQAAGKGVNNALVPVDEKHSVDLVVPPAGRISAEAGSAPLIAIGASLGGTEAIKEVLAALPSNLPPIVITQHIPPGFSATFAMRMNRVTPLRVHEAEDGQPLLPGHVYIAPGDRHLMVGIGNKGYHCRLHDGPQVNRHKPSVDVLFRSVIHCAGDNAIGVLLTGMGDDGARCLLEMREAGARTLVQDEASSIVWGMPGAATRLGGAEQVLPLEEIPSALAALSHDNKPETANRPELANGGFLS